MAPCHRCGLQLAETERFCPYCHAPAPGSRLHPTWAPEDRTMAAEVEADGLVEDPSPTCPRCARPVTDADAFCRRCGMALEDPDLRAGWEPPEPGEPWPTGWGSEYPVWPGEEVRAVPAFEDAAVVGRTVRGLMGVLSGIAFAGMAAAIAWERSLDRAVREGSAAAVDRATLAESWLRSLDRVGVLVALAAIVAFAIWTGRAYRNLPALGARGLRFSRPAAVLAWLVPGLNLVRPRRVLADLWRGSDPDRPLHPSVAWRSDRVPLSLSIWWVAAVATPFLLVGVSLFVDPTELDVTRRGEVALLRVGVHAIELLTTALGFGLVGDITRRQRRRADAIGWPALQGYPIPAPGERVVPPPPERPAEPDFKHDPAKGGSADVAGKY